MQLVLTTELLIEAYKQGLFPMAYSARSPYIHWICPDKRGRLPIENLHIPKSLKKIVKPGKLRGVPYEIKIDTAFEQVVKNCATPHEGRPETWINDTIRKAFCRLHADGHAHSVEIWVDNALAGGLYGLSIGGAFFGESMFSHVSNASKITLVHLAARLWKGGYTMLDTQFVNDHLRQFGIYEQSYPDFTDELHQAAKLPADFALEGIHERDLIREYFEFRKEQN